MSLKLLDQMSADQEADTIFRKTGRALYHGGLSAVVSAANSFANTGIALGNMFGGEFEYNDTEDVVRNWLGDETADYYKDNSGWIDTVGLVAGSFVPGTIALKAARAMAAGTLSTTSSRIGTGLRNALLNDRKLADWESMIKRGKVNDKLEGNRMKLLMEGSTSAMVESVIYETATLLTMNQNPILTSDDVGYLEAIGSNLESAFFGMVLGGGIGGGLNYFGAKSRLVKFMADHEKEVLGDLIHFRGTNGALAGDQIVLATTKLNQVDARIKELEALPKAEQEMHARAFNILNGTRAEIHNQIVSEINKASKIDGVDLGTRLINSLIENKVEIADWEKLLAGARQFLPLKAPVRGATADAVGAIDREYVESMSLFTERYMNTEVDAFQAIAAFESDLLAERVGQNAEAMVLEAAGYLKADTIAKLWSPNTKVRVNLTGPDGKALMREDFEPHELLGFALPKSRKGKYKGKVAPEGKISTIIDLREEMLEFLTEFDPQYRDLTFKAESFIHRLKAKEKLSDETIEEIGAMVNLNMYHPSHMFAATYKVMNQAELDPKMLETVAGMKGRFRALYEYMNNNKALRHKYGSVDLVYNIASGGSRQGTTVPYFSDLGSVKVSRHGVTAGGASVAVTPATLRNLRELSATEESGVHIWAASKSGAGADMFTTTGEITKAWASELRLDSIPVMSAVLSHYSWSKPLTFVDAAGKDVLVSNATELRQHLHTAKQNYIRDLAKSEVGQQEWALRADVSPEYADAAVVRMSKHDSAAALGKDFPEAGVDDTGGALYTAEKIRKFDGETEEFLQQNIVIRYGADAFDKFGKPMDSMLDVQQRVARQRQIEFTAAARALNLTARETEALGLGVNGETQVYKDITKQSDTATTLTSVASEYMNTQSVAQERGRMANVMDARDRKAITAEFEPLVKAINASSGAVSEASVLFNSVLRQGDYFLMTPATDFISPAAHQLYQMLEIDVAKEIAERVFVANGLEGAAQGRHIILKDVIDQMDDLARNLDIPDNVINAAAAAAEAGDQQALRALQNSLKQNLKSVTGEMSGLASRNYKINGTTAIYEVKHKPVSDFLVRMTEVNNRWLLQPAKELAIAENSAFHIDPRSLYPGRFNTDRTPHYALVRHANADTNPWAGKDSGMIFASSEADLNRQIDFFRSKYGKDVEIITRDQYVRDLKAQRRYDAELDLTETQVNSQLRNEGKLWDAAPQFNPHVMEDYVNDFVRRRSNLVKRGLHMLYKPDIEALEAMHNSVIRSGRFGAKAGEKSAYQKNINLMLGLKTTDDSNMWLSVQQTVNKAISRVANTVSGAYIQAKTSGNWKEFSETLDRYGLPQLVTGKEDWILSKLANDDSVMPEFIGKLNGTLSFLMLRIDQAHNIVNALSMPIMSHPEMTALKAAIARSNNPRLNSVLSASADGTPDLRMPSNTKLLYQAVKNWFSRPDLVEDFTNRGLVGSDALEMRQLLDGISFSPDSDFVKQVRKAANFLAKPADYSESFVRFVSGDMARQLLDAVGVSTKDPMYWSTISTYMSRVNGNYLANQRATLFNGWAGSAIGLFQTYQFNLIQQFTRHLGDNKKAARQMMAIQTGIFGTQSLPGFQIMNQMIGEHALGERDIYSTVTDTLDSPVAEFLLYGGGSSLTRPLFGGKGIDFSGRGNLTPRTPILIPTHISEVPAFSMVGNAIKTAHRTFESLVDGVPLGDALLEGLAHNGMSRPVQGVAQLLQGKRTTQAGVTLFNYADWDFATWATKLMGTHTLSEGIAANAYYRSMAYRANRMEELNDLAALTRTHLRAVGTEGVDTEALLREYVAKGGKAKTFNRWYKNQVVKMEDSAIGLMKEKLHSQEGLYLQKILGNAVDEIEIGAFSYRE